MSIAPSGTTSNMSWRAAAILGLAALMVATGPALSQGLVKGVEQGARQGSKAAGPVGGVLGGAIGGVVGVVTGVLGVPSQQRPAPAPQAAPAKDVGKAATTKAERRQAARAKQPPAPEPLTPEQIVATSDANIERIKAELNLNPDQEKHWGGFTSAMHYLGRNGADRLALRNARARRDPPDDIIEQMRNEAQFLNDRAVDQRNVADAAEPLFASLDEKQKSAFITEMVKLSRERGLD